MDLNELYQELIIDHGTQPRNFRVMPAATCAKEGYNPLCGDKVCLQLCVENNSIQDVCFQGQGCAISMASASLMTELLIGKTLNEATALVKQLQQHLTDHSSTTSAVDNLNLGKLTALTGVRAFPARVKCATLAWHTLQAAIEES